jgi:hypothetical protein
MLSLAEVREGCLESFSWKFDLWSQPAAVVLSVRERVQEEWGREPSRISTQMQMIEAIYSRRFRVARK